MQLDFESFREGAYILPIVLEKHAGESIDFAKGVSIMRDNVVLSQNEIQEIVKRIGKEITEAVKDDPKIPVVMGVMRGAMFFFADVLRNIDCPVYMDTVKTSSWEGTSSTGKIVLEQPFKADIKDRTVILVEDVVDTGITMDFLKKYLENEFAPKRVLIASLFNKLPDRKVKVDVDFVGKELTDSLFLMGYGLDYYELDRHVPFVYCASKEDIERMEEDRKH